MSEPQEIVAAIEELLCPRQDYAGVKVLVTAGATRERLDPVRFLSNDSSGKMGFAIAAAARDRGADVTVVCGITQVEPPTGVRVIRVESTQELYDAVTAEAKLADVVIQAAAPADYRFAVRHDQKLKKQDGMPFMVELVENPDIAAAVGYYNHRYFYSVFKAKTGMTATEYRKAQRADIAPKEGGEA